MTDHTVANLDCGRGESGARSQQVLAYQRRLAFHLAAYTMLGALGVGLLLYGGLVGDWTTFVAGVVYANAIVYMLMSGQWLKGLRP